MATSGRVLAAAVGLAQLLQDDVPVLSGADADRELQAFVAWAFRCEATTADQLVLLVEEQRVRLAVWRSAGRQVHQPRHWLRYAEAAMARRFGAGKAAWCVEVPNG
jgi:LmbE family N-acetylglucosaminyl deacetylase